MPTEPETGEKIIKADYIKSNYFRVIHADGIFGGLTPQGNIQMEVWSERQAIPKQSSFRIVTEGDGPALGEEIVEQRVSRDAFIREVEAGIVISHELAKAMIVWLQTRVDALDAAKKSETDVAEGGASS